MIKYKNDLKIFIILFVICGIISLILCKTPDYDFYNYSVYNAYAFLNDRISTDFMPASFRSYFNPYLDTFIYFLIKIFNTHPYIYYIVNALNPALTLFLTYKISKTILKENHIYIMILIIFYSFISNEIYRVINPVKTDLYIANFVLITFYMLIKNLFSDNPKRLRNICFAGLISGLTVTLKLSSFVYPLTFCLCMLFFGKKFLKPLLIFAGTTFISFLITDGYWLYKIYSNFLNPFFPYFNNIFKSPFADYNDILTFDFSHIRPANLFEFIFYPFLWSSNHTFGLEDMNRDPRYAINIFCIVVLFFPTFVKQNTIKNENYIYFLFLFSVISYYINTYFFGQYRYIVATSMLFGLILFITLNLIIKNQKSIKICMTAMFLFVIFYQSGSLYNDRIDFKDNLLFDNNKISLKDNSNVIFATVESSYGILYLKDDNAKFTTFTFPKYVYEKVSQTSPDFTNIPVYSKYMENLLSEILKSKEPVYVVYLSKYFDKHKEFYIESLEHYAGEKIELTNCEVAGKKINPVTVCELEYQ